MSRTSPRRIAATVSVSAAAVLAAGVALAVPQAADAAPAWASTSTQALSPTLRHATYLGAAPASTPLRLTVGLTPRNHKALTSLINGWGEEWNLIKACVVFYTFSSTLR